MEIEREAVDPERRRLAQPQVLGKSAISCPSSRKAIRPSRWPGVLAFTISS
jgi:hypothetical protein